MKISLVTTALLAAFLAYGTLSHAYSAPDSSAARLVFDEKQLIADRDPPTEILIRTFKNDDGTMFREYSIRGRVFRYDVDEDGSTPYEYRLLDNDGDGEFETRERLIGETVVKDRGERYFIDLGPEPGKEYHYRYEKDIGKTDMRQEALILEGRSIYIPTWVLVEF